MRKLILTFVVVLIGLTSFAQTYTSNTHAVGLEHNMLFNAHKRYTVTQTGGATLNLSTLFDGIFVPSYTATAPSITSPTEILIEGLPAIHVQTGGWVGWSTRYWQANRFKIEGYDQHSGANVWKTIADYSNTDYSGGTSFIKKMPSGAYTKLKFTFYTTVAVNGRLGVSELFFLHPEATAPYQGLSESYWEKAGDKLVHNGHVNIGGSVNGQLWVRNINGKEPTTANHDNLHLNYSNGKDVYIGGSASASGSDLFIPKGNVGIGTSDTKGYNLAIAGKAIAEEVVVKLQSAWPDYVFENNYNLPTLEEVEKQIKEKGHLSNIPSAKEVEKNGVQLGEINKKLLEKIEELTLYTIQQEKRIKELEEQQKKIKELEEKLKALLQK